MLPKYNNFKFLIVKAGYYFGELDILFYNEIRQYTFMASKDSELLVLSKKHFKNAFLVEFRDIGFLLYLYLFIIAYVQLNFCFFKILFF